MDEEQQDAQRVVMNDSEDVRGLVDMNSAQIRELIKRLDDAAIP